MIFCTTLRGQRYSFPDLRDLMAKANEEKSGDALAGIAAASHSERAAAKTALAVVPLSAFLDTLLLSPDEDDVSRVLLDDHDAAAFTPLAGWTVGELRDHLLSETTTADDIPGLRMSDSLSAYLAHRPRPGHTDAHRNLVSNIQAAGTSPARAVERIMAIVAAMMRRGISGPAIKE
jgi:ethanolamine ammonia-lyase large subunit